MQVYEKTRILVGFYKSTTMTLTSPRPLTYQAFREMDFPEEDSFLYELINGALVKKSAPSVQHQRAVRNFYDSLSAFVRVQRAGEVLFAPVDVKLSDHNAPQPDLLFIRTERLSIIQEEAGFVDGAPDLVVEVMSPSTAKRDRIDKMKLYAEYGVLEYWIVDPLNKSIEVYRLRESAYALQHFAESGDTAGSGILAGFSISVDAIVG